MKKNDIVKLIYYYPDDIKSPYSFFDRHNLTIEELSNLPFSVTLQYHEEALPRIEYYPFDDEYDLKYEIKKIWR